LPTLPLTGIFKAYPKAWATEAPTRSPVNEPGPSSTSIPSKISNPRGLIQGGSQSNLGGLDAFFGNGMQTTIKYTDDGLEIFQAAWRIFQNMWYKEKIRMVGASVSNLKPAKPVNLSLLPEENNKEIIYQALDCINNKFGNFTLQRATLLSSCPMQRKPNPFLSDRRFKL